ncbi:hypothetical protein ACKKE1_005001, partial [Escherichia coli]
HCQRTGWSHDLPFKSGPTIPPDVFFSPELRYSHLQWHKSVSAMIFDRYRATDILLTGENYPAESGLFP